VEWTAQVITILSPLAGESEREDLPPDYWGLQVRLEFTISRKTLV